MTQGNDKYVVGRLETWVLKSKIREARRKGIGTQIIKSMHRLLKDLVKDSDYYDILRLSRDIAFDYVTATDTKLAQINEKKSNKRKQRKEKRKARKN